MDLIGRKETPKLGGRCFISCGEMNVPEGETERYNYVSLLALPRDEEGFPCEYLIEREIIKISRGSKEPLRNFINLFIPPTAYSDAS